MPKESNLALMRKINLIHFLIFTAPIIIGEPVLISTAHAQTTSSIPKTESSVTEVKPKKLSKAERLEALFVELRREPNQGKAKQLASRIALNWSNSGSATSNALMMWAQQAMKDKRYSVALELLDQVIVLKPGYAEGWNRRATLHYLMNNHAKSMADIEKTLALEPRHFGALSGMAAILAGQGEDDKALQVYEKVLSIYPANRGAQANLLKIIQKLEKSEI